MTDAFQAKLEELKKEVRRELRPIARPVKKVVSAATRPSGVATPILVGALKVAAIVAFPFLVYVRTSVGLYSSAGAPAWGAVAGGAIVTTALIAVYAWWLSKRFKGRKRAASIARWVAIPTAIAWCGYAALYLARVNAKTDQVRDYYASVHPVLRVALGTAILFDKNVVITDAQRVARDYTRMGLPINEHTRHYVQRNGWVHAVDLRTNGHGEARNRALQAYFAVMGFQTLRHVGTADHLHVQLAVR